LGCKHSDYNDLTLLTEEALLAYERTEAYEWAKRQANKDACFVKFQPFKLLYAMLLADAGEVVQAQKIIKSMRLSSNNLASVTEIKKVSVTQMFDDNVAFELACEEFKWRIESNDAPTIKYREVLANGGSLDISASEIQRMNRMHEPEIDETFMTTKSNLLNVSGYSLDEGNETAPLSSKEEPINERSEKKLPTKKTPLEKKPPLQKTSQDTSLPNNDRPSSQFSTMPPANVEQEKQQQQPARIEPLHSASTPVQRQRPKSPPATAPPVMQGKKTEKPPGTPAPASGGGKKTTATTPKAPSSGAFGGMKSWLIKKFNPDATECALPDNEEQPYYDKDLKRWIFPGDDPAEVAKPLAPPPTIGKLPTETTAPKKEEPKDAVSMMMSPPASRGLSSKKSGIGGRYPPGFGGSGGGPMGTMMMPPGGAPPGMTSTPAVFTPKAAVFTPKPAAVASEEGETNRESKNQD